MTPEQRAKLDAMRRTEILHSLQEDPTGGEDWRRAKWDWISEDDRRNDRRMGISVRAAVVAAIAAVVAAVAAIIAATWPMLK